LDSLAGVGASGNFAERCSRGTVFEMTFHIGSTKRWWNKPIREGSNVRMYGFIAVMVGAALYEILSSPIARWWLGGLIVGSVLVAVVLRWQRGDGL
jgi:uncharacterized membrane protein YraQ (UPF0718 family)